jgi:hypothetical protein
MAKPSHRPTDPLEPHGFDPQSLDPETIAAHYRLLDLRPGATIEEVDRAYFRLKRQVSQEELPALKTAHQTVKGMLLHYFAESAAPTSSEAPPGSTGVPIATDSPEFSEAQRHAPFFVQLVRQWLVQGGITAEVMWKDPELHIRVPVQQYPTPDKVLPKIQRSLQKLTDGERQGLGSIKVYGVQRGNHLSWKRDLRLAPSSPGSAATVPLPILILNAVGLSQLGSTWHDRWNEHWNDLFWFPAVSLLAIFCNHFPLTNFLLIGLRIWLHEWGHATIAWLSGYRAIPLPFGWTNVEEIRSLWFYASVLALIGLFGWSSYRERQTWGVGVAIGLGMLQLWLTWGISADTFGLLFAFGGVGGEFYLCALLMIAFFFPLPQRFRWEINRFPVNFAAAVTFWNAVFLWQKIDRGQAFIPWGTLLGGEGDAGGDMNILVNYGWSYDRIIDTYHTLGNLCILVILGIYGYIIWQALRKPLGI